jgi:hypothetical protein
MQRAAHIVKPVTTKRIGLSVLLAAVCVCCLAPGVALAAETPKVLGESPLTVEGGAATLQAEINPGGAETAYRFEYGTSEAYGQSSESGVIEAGSEPKVVNVRITGLVSGTTYHYRVVATNEQTSAGGKPGHDKTFTTLAALGSESPENCPNKQLRVEQPFGLTLPDCRAYEMVSPAETGGQDATDAGIQTVAHSSVSGEAFTYSSRGVFGSAAEGGVVENQFLARRGPEGWATQSITLLHDPTQLEPQSSYEASAFTPELGEGVAATNAALSGTGAPPDPPSEGGSREEELYLANFATGSYQYIGFGTDPVAASSDLTHVAFGELGGLSEWINGKVVSVGVANDDEEMSAAAGMAVVALNPGLGRQKDAWHAASSEGSRVYFTSPAEVGSEDQLYVRVNSEMSQSPLSDGDDGEANGTGTLTEGSDTVTSLVTATGITGGSPVGVTELGVKPRTGRFIVGAGISGPGIAAGTKIIAVRGGSGGTEVLTLSAPTVAEVPFEARIEAIGPVPFVAGQRISGSGIVPGTTIEAVAPGILTLSAPAVGSGTAVPLVGGGECTVAADACTIEVSASQRSAPDPHVFAQPARYWGASANGALVFFTSNAELTNDAYTGEADNAANLYEYDLEDHALTDLTVDTGNVAEGAAVQGVVQISEDGSYVYFVATGVLKGVHGEVLRNSVGAEPVAGEDNMYVSHGGKTQFVATLAAGDESDWHNGAFASSGAGPAVNSAVTSEGGEYLAFMSEASLTGYDNIQSQSGECAGRVVPETGLPGTEYCREVYLYDATAGSLVCASCNPSGARPVGPSHMGQLPKNDFAEYRPRNVLNDGTVFFNSADQLVSRASDGLSNVYEYEDGRVYAISNVAGGSESFFLDSGNGPHSEEGGNVFFATGDQLLPEDPGGNVVVYDARVDGGFPVQTSAPSCDNGDSCKPPPSQQPSVFGAPASATFSGPGNMTVPPPPAVVEPKAKTVRCKKGYAKNKQGKCVRKTSKKTKRARKAGNERRAR